MGGGIGLQSCHGHHDWVKPLYGQKHYMCQNLVFLNVSDVNNDNHTNFKVGRYVLVHFINENVLVMFWK